jgi:hypothetical protein
MGTHIVSDIDTSTKRDDTERYQRLASTIFQQLVATDSASETLSNLKRLHGLMPYFVMKGILKVSNPMAMIRGAGLS